jgi:hypothetical protein
MDSMRSRPPFGHGVEPAEDDADSSHYFVETERLVDVVVAADGEARGGVFCLVACGEEHDPDAGAIFANLSHAADSARWPSD